jgi:SAM-dependent methyltransferase
MEEIFMLVYAGFAEIYQRAEWYQFTLRFLELFPTLQKKYGLPVNGKLLDIACGTGVFSVKMAAKGWQSTGVDLSTQMLLYARQNAIEARLKAVFYEQDMRHLAFSCEFDLVTCLFDSLNYLLEPLDLLETFKGVQRALKQGGWFVFDMNTIYGLAVDWQSHGCNLQVNSPDLLVVTRPSYDDLNQIAGLEITGFIQRGEMWERVDETHYERGYALEEIRGLLKEAGLEVEACLGSVLDMSAPQEKSKRVWFIARKAL